MKNKLAIAFFLALFAAKNLHAQQQPANNLPVIGKEIKGRLTEAKGYMYNDKEWVSRPNKIPYKIGAQFKAVIDADEEGLGNNRENFIYMELRDVTINGTVYSLLLKVFNDGFYREPDKKKGWMPQTSITGYVFPTTELDKLKNLKEDIANNIKINTTYCLTIVNLDPKWNLHKFEQSLADFIASDEKPAFKEDLMVNIKLSKGSVFFIINSSVSFAEPEKLTHYFYKTTPEEFSKLFKLQ